MNFLDYFIILFFSLSFITVENACSAESQVSSALHQEDTLPNILLIMADDMGFSDIGCYGSEIPTPAIDALAEEGMRFTQFYNTGRCCPSRASLMTGIYPHHVGMGWMTVKDLGHPGYKGRLSDQAFTIAEGLKMAGYETFMSGKWHLTPDDSTRSMSIGGSWPFQRGFDEFYGTMEGAKDYFKPKFLFRNEQPLTTGDHYFYTHAVSDSAAAFITNRNHENPFFLYTAFYAPHFPLHAPDSTVQKYRGKYRNGWTVVRKQRFQKQKSLGIISENSELSMRDDDISDWDSLTEEQKDEMDLRMAIYAAQIEELDKGIGKIIQTLKESGDYENTIIVFLSDNGAIEDSEFGKGKEKNLNQSGPYTSYGRAWSHVSNTPYRKYKKYNHEGGIISPLIVCHKDLVKAGSINQHPAHIIDLMPTFLDIAGVSLPSQRNGESIIEVQGQSLVPLLKKTSHQQDARALFWEHEGNRAVRLDNWKLVSVRSNDRWELYDLSNDPTETKDLSEKFPLKVEELEERWNIWAENHQVLPLDTRDWSARLKSK